MTDEISQDIPPRKFRPSKKPEKRAYSPSIENEAARIVDLEAENRRLSAEVEQIRRKMEALENTPIQPFSTEVPSLDQSTESLVDEIDQGRNNLDNYYGSLKNIFGHTILECGVRADVASNDRDLEVSEDLEFYQGGPKLRKKARIQVKKRKRNDVTDTRLTEISVNILGEQLDSGPEICTLRIYIEPGYAAKTDGISAIELELKNWGKARFISG